MRTLPASCATTNMDGKPIVLFRGSCGYYLKEDDFDIDAYNEARGVTEEAIRVMTCASMFGWDIPAVTNYGEGK